MKPNRVPDDLIEAGFDAIRAWYAAHPDANHFDDTTRMRLVLAAALTVHDQRAEQRYSAALDELERLRAERSERDFRWEEWAVQLHFPGGLTTVEHDCEDAARDHYRLLLKEPVQRAERIEVVRRVMVQGAYVAAPQQPERGGEVSDA